MYELPYPYNQQSCPEDWANSGSESQTWNDKGVIE